MDAGGWFATLAGIGLFAAIFVEIVLAVLHIDHDGFAAPWLQRGRMRPARRELMALAGPLKMVATFVL